MYKKYCPFCSNELALKQINLSLAVYICVNCPYPRDNDLCTIIERKIDDIDKPLETQKPQDWLDELVDFTIEFNKETTGESASVKKSPPKSQELVELSNICNQLDTTEDCGDFSGDLDRILDYLNCN